ncbi:hypothetical protein ERJ75_000461300 [Trypanosoma vivax]|uniref:HMG box domain-containing protein n=1 Tax=Trypanosoma vivax (strain Y486) TaxID=1055687 RepID=G0U550_TRYVY|nr:hypothetical protein TRVL_04650 [Trypanosoma vivax]KAH8616549.1 hypothetical protein ERJ75_000461300 [Trypanosoma vivax]CCC50998.1 conserved hypothetical protein [Trypanosoma vivax Y486]
MVRTTGRKGQSAGLVLTSPSASLPQKNSSQRRKRVAHGGKILLQCGHCKRRTTCCSGCGASNFIIVHSYSHEVAGGAPDTSVTAVPSLPTAFELFCRDAKTNKRLGICVSSASDGSGISLDERRLMAEAWLCAEPSVRALYERAATSGSVNGQKALGLPAASGQRGQLAGCSDIAVAKKARAAKGLLPNGDGKHKRSSPTAFAIFSARKRAHYKGDTSAITAAWESMSEAEKQAYDDEAATLRVSRLK